VSSAAPIDKRRVRMRFDRIAPGYESAAVLHREVGARLLGRLDLVRLRPTRVLDLGGGAGALARGLIERYPAADAVVLDLSLKMLRAGSPARSGLSRLLVGRRSGPLKVCADMEALPFRNASMQMVCSNLALEWSSRPEQVMREVHRILSVGGLFTFTTLGPDSLQELRRAGGEAGASFPDMHDIGDLLVHAGFADPVMDMEHLMLTYATLEALLSELRATGCMGASRGSGRGLRGRDWLRRLEQGYERERRDGRLPVTFEIVYGHAWRAESPAIRPSSDGRAVIEFHPRRK
jgi:malonyl-CoA O-methyltransferase